MRKPIDPKRDMAVYLWLQMCHGAAMEELEVTPGVAKILGT